MKFQGMYKIKSGFYIGYDVMLIRDNLDGKYLAVFPTIGAAEQKLQALVLADDLGEELTEEERKKYTTPEEPKTSIVGG